jgi:hypothetical protein
MEIVLDKSNNTHKYITHFKSKFDKSKIVTVLKPIPSLNKPEKALWACRTDKDYWVDWYKENVDETEKYFYMNTFSLKEGSKIFTIDRLDDVYELTEKDYFKPVIDDIGWCKDVCLDFPNLPYDAIEYNNACIGHIFKDRFEMAFNSWDVECLLVLNPDIILWD